MKMTLISQKQIVMVQEKRYLLQTHCNVIFASGFVCHIPAELHQECFPKIGK